MIAYECIVGRRPFTGDELGELVIAICTRPVPVPSENGVVPAGFDEWFVKATQRDRERRFASAREMADELIKLSSAVGPSRSQFTTLRNVASIASTIPRPKVLSSRPPSADKLDLTTGQRAATSESLHQSREPVSPAVYALIAAAALIVAGVGVFVASGGASAFKGAAAPRAAVASLTTTLPVAAASQVQVAPAAPAGPRPSASASGAAPAAGSARSARAQEK